MSRQTLKVLGTAYFFSSLVLVAAVIATHLLGQAVLHSMAGLFGVILLGVS